MGSRAVVIPAFRSERTLRRCLELFAEEPRDAKLIVIDSSPGRSAVAVARRIGGAPRLVSERRLLPHVARNLGARSIGARAAWRHGVKAEAVAAPPVVATSPPTGFTGERVGMATGLWTAVR